VPSLKVLCTYVKFTVRTDVPSLLLHALLTVALSNAGPPSLDLFRNEAGPSLRIAGGGTAINKMTLVMPVEAYCYSSSPPLLAAAAAASLA
jgi:hypothetical protein